MKLTLALDLINKYFCKSEVGCL